MCESNVYLNKAGQEELLMEKVDRIIPAEDGSIFLENVFGERRVIKARIIEMELVRHRIVMEETSDAAVAQKRQEIWLEPATDHGHFHAGEEVILRVHKGYNMKPGDHKPKTDLQAFGVSEGMSRPLTLQEHHGNLELNLGQEADGLLHIYVREDGDHQLYGVIVMEIGHHHHHGLKPLGLPLEIVPADYSHARMGDSYEIRVLADGKTLAGIRVSATYAGTHNREYPHHLKTDEEGRAKIFLTARGNYLFSVTKDNITSTFTLVKSF
ncbi:MAG: CooT family nickel-binding protein [Syntrophomonadaceae bacterium]|nr:CooT family nickel-binding protein [Syntrophomonadaceae bacterium]